jgi:hypothetical protein
MDRCRQDIGIKKKDMVVGPDEITLSFADYFDFSQVPIKEFRHYRCKILRFPRYGDNEGREALEVSEAIVFHDELDDDKRNQPECFVSEI